MFEPLPPKVEMPNFSFISFNLLIDGLDELIYSGVETYFAISPPAKASAIYPLPIKPIDSSIASFFG